MAPNSLKGAYNCPEFILYMQQAEPKGNDRSLHSQQVKPSKYFHSSQVRDQPRKSGDIIFPIIQWATLVPQHL